MCHSVQNYANRILYLDYCSINMHLKIASPDFKNVLSLILPCCFGSFCCLRLSEKDWWEFHWVMWKAGRGYWPDSWIIIASKNLSFEAERRWKRLRLRQFLYGCWIAKEQSCHFKSFSLFGALTWSKPDSKSGIWSLGWRSTTRLLHKRGSKLPKLGCLHTT